MAIPTEIVFEYKPINFTHREHKIALNRFDEGEGGTKYTTVLVAGVEAHVSEDENEHWNMASQTNGYNNPEFIASLKRVLDADIDARLAAVAKLSKK